MKDRCKERWYVTDDYTLDSFQLIKSLPNTPCLNGITYIDKNKCQTKLKDCV